MDALIDETEATLELLNKLSSNVLRKDGMDETFRKDMGRLVAKFRSVREIACDEDVSERVLNSICNSKLPDSLNKHAIDTAVQEMHTMIEKRNNEIQSS